MPDPQPAPGSPTPPPGSSSGGALSLAISCPAPAALENLLQAGFWLPLPGPMGLPDFLLQEMAIPEAYAHDRLQTVFVNGRPVDDFAAILVKPHDRLALCAAMPGLVGATMRRAGILAGFRQGISQAGHPTAAHAAPASGGLVFVKLFNLVARELAGHVLARGLLVDADRLSEFLTHEPASVTAASLGGRALETAALPAALRPLGESLVRLSAIQPSAAGFPSAH